MSFSTAENQPSIWPGKPKRLNSADAIRANRLITALP